VDIPEPGTFVAAALVCFVLGGVCFLCAGATVLARTIRGQRRP
jgi:hypothetical protein